MKTSNKLLIGYFGFIIAMMFFIAFQLKAEYQKIDLNDKFRQYEKIPLHNVRFLKINSTISKKSDENQIENEFLLTCLEGKKQELLLPKNQEFLKQNFHYKQKGDTLFLISNFTYQSSYNNFYLRGSHLEGIDSDCARILVDNQTSSKLNVRLKEKARIEFTRINSDELSIEQSNFSHARIAGKSTIKNLSLNLNDHTNCDLKEAKIDKISLKMSQEASILMNKENLNLLKK